MTSKPIFEAPTAHKQLRRDLEERFDAWSRPETGWRSQFPEREQLWTI